jgi:hypothetical protein
MAESECTPSEIMASLVHRSLKEAVRYTGAFNRAKAADRALTKIAEAKAKAVAAQAEPEAVSNVVTLPVASR